MKGTELAVAAAVAVGLAFGMSFVHPFGDPRLASRTGRETLLLHSHLPEDARRVLVTKCADCHSNETEWPVYSDLAPGSWLIERDIVQARKKINLSDWDLMDADAQQEGIRQIIHEAKSGEMPPAQYRLLHPGAQLNAQDVAILVRLQSGQTAPPQASPVAAGDAMRGKAAFEKRCTGCHSLDDAREGPPLRGVYGRKAGSVAGFGYSEALKKYGMTWDEAKLEQWLSDPDSLVTDNKMDFHLPKAQERADVIAYFKELSTQTNK